MKKYLPHLDLITLGTAGIGILLRFWLLGIGEDENGLYPANHISWILLLALSAALAVFLFLIAGQAGKSRSYRANFSASLSGAVGFAIAACGMVVSALQHFGTGGIILYRVTGALGFLAAAALVLGGFCRWKGTVPHFLVFALPCAYLGLRLFCMGHIWGDEPELHRFLLGFFATAATVMACYHLWGFSVGLGNRAASLLWSLLGSYLCLVAMPGSGDWPFYLGTAVWLFTNLCPKKAAPFRPEFKPEPMPASAPEQSETAAETPVELPQEADPEIEAIIAELRQKTDEMKE